MRRIISLLGITISLLCITVLPVEGKTGLEIVKEKLAKMEEAGNKLCEILDRNLPFIIIPQDGRTLFADVNSSQIIGLTFRNRYVVVRVARDENNLIMLQVTTLRDPKKYWLAFSPKDEIQDEKIKKEISRARIDFSAFTIW